MALSYADSDRPSKALSGTTVMREVAVPQTSRLVSRHRGNYAVALRRGVILLGISRNGVRLRERLREVEIQAGTCCYYWARKTTRRRRRVAWLSAVGAARARRHSARQSPHGDSHFCGCALASRTYLPAHGARRVAVLYVVLDIVPLSQVYESIEWPVVVLLGAMIPISVALESSGGTQLLADLFVQSTNGWPVILVLAALMLLTMTLSDVLNNVATALIAAPIALDIALQLEVNPDPFLMAVAVAASCAFLTPIGHKNNTLIMGPGGYRFGDYWRMGLPLELLVIFTALPMIVFVWPL